MGLILLFKLCHFTEFGKQTLHTDESQESIYRHEISYISYNISIFVPYILRKHHCKCKYKILERKFIVIYQKLLHIIEFFVHLFVHFMIIKC